METLEKLFVRYGTSLDSIKTSGMMDKWEIRAIEDEDFGKLRLSSLEKLVETLCRQNESEPAEAMSELLDIVTHS